MSSKQCNVHFRYQICICCSAEEGYGNPWSIWSFTGPCGCLLTSSQQSCLQIHDLQWQYQRVQLLWENIDLFQKDFPCSFKWAAKGLINSYVSLISGLHSALLQSITFISRLNTLDYTKLRSWNLRCIKIFNRHKIKDHSDMFRIVCDPSSELL